MIRKFWWVALLALPLAASFLAQNEAEIYRDVSPSVVSIAVEISRDEIAGGAGFVIDQDGHILTNAHVIEDGRALTALFHDGYEAPARLIGMDSRVDLAVIKVDVARHRLQPAVFGNSDALVVGQAVVAIGSPHGLDATLTRGIISGLNRKLDFDDGTAMDGAIQTDAMLAPGNSGGPLLNQAGEVIGVNTAGYRGTALGFAIPSNVARRVVESMIVSVIPWVTQEAAAAYATFEAAWATSEAAAASFDKAVGLAETIATEMKRRFGQPRIISNADLATVGAWATLASQAIAAAEEIYEIGEALEATADAAYANLKVRAPDIAATWETKQSTATYTPVPTDLPKPSPTPTSTLNPTVAAQMAWESFAAAQATADTAKLTLVAADKSVADLQAMFEKNPVAQALATINAAMRTAGVSISRNQQARDYEAFLQNAYLSVLYARVADEQDRDIKQSMDVIMHLSSEEHKGTAVSPAAWATAKAVGTQYDRHRRDLTRASVKASSATKVVSEAYTTLQAWAPEKAATVSANMTEVAMATPTPTPYRVTVDNAVNLRAGPGTEHPRVGVAQPGDSFAVIGYQAGSPYNWLKVRYDGGVAWIAESLTRVHSSSR